MSKDQDPPEDRPYEVGYGKPPKEHQFKAKDRDPADPAPQRRKRRKCADDKPEQVDLSRLFALPVPVAKGGRLEKMDAYEVMLRQQVKQAIQTRSLPAIKAVIDVAAEHDLLRVPPSAPGGGVVLVPLTSEEDLARYKECLFPTPDADPSNPEDNHE